MFDFSDLDDDDDEVLDVVEDNISDASQLYPGDVVKGHFRKAHWHLATIKENNGDGTYTIEWNDGDANDLVKTVDELKLVRRAKGIPDASESDDKAAAEREAKLREEELRARAESEAIALEAERQARIKAQEDERVALERAEAERIAREEKERAEREAKAQAEQKAREAKEQAEKEAQLEAERQAIKAREEAEKEAQQRLQDERAALEKASIVVNTESNAPEEKPQENSTEHPENDAEDRAKHERALKEKSIEEQKEQAEVLRKEKEKRVLEKAGGRVPGVRVKLKDMKEKPQMNEACGTLVEQKGERWIVNLDGAPGVGKGKWMINGRNLVAAQWNCTEPKIRYSIVGSWNNWSPVDLEWDVDRQCWHHNITVGDRGWESFQFVAEGDPNKCVHPDQKDASPHMPHKMCGPDFEGHGQNWAVGKHPLDKGKKGATYQIWLSVWEDEAPRTCEWDPPGASPNTPASRSLGRQKYSIAGTWNNWVAKDMDWDETQDHFFHFLQLSSQGWESFQILLDGDYKRCIHPSISDANPFVPYTLSGPDNRGHGKNWTIGKHTLDKGCKGARYKVRFFPADEGRAGLVDWEPVSASAVKSEKQKEGSSGAKKFCIAGTWGNWSANEMNWDEKRRCYQHTVRLGLNGWESFQILVDGDYKKCIHPDCSDATPHEKHAICGPDSQGHGKNWTIGRHRCDLGSRGSQFEVRLYIDDDGNAKSIEWERIATSGLGK